MRRCAHSPCGRERCYAPDRVAFREHINSSVADRNISAHRLHSHAALTIARRTDEPRARPMSARGFRMAAEAIADRAAEARRVVLETRLWLHSHGDISADRFRLHAAIAGQRAAQRQIA